MKVRCLNFNGAAVPSDKVMAILSVNTNPVKDMVKSLKEQNLIIDLTKGKTTKSVVLLSDGKAILSTITVETLSDRFNKLEL